MKTMLTKIGLSAALAATALATAAPADAQRWGGYRHHRGGGDVAGAALLGGVAGLAIGAALASDHRGRYYDRGGYYNGYNGYNGYSNDSYYSQPYYDNYNYQPRYRRCWTERRWSDYYGQPVRVRVCN